MTDNAKEVHGEVAYSSDSKCHARCQVVYPIGNHDDHPFEVIKNGKIKDEIDAQASRKDLLEVDSTSFYNSYTQPGKLSSYVAGAAIP